MSKNQDLKFERTASGELLIISLTGGETGNPNIEIAYQLQGWSRQNNLGKAFDSSTGFKLPNGANRSPDASWITIEKWESLTKEQRRKFLPLCPDFVISGYAKLFVSLRSRSVSDRTYDSEAIARLWDCFVSLRSTRNDKCTINFT